MYSLDKQFRHLQNIHTNEDMTVLEAAIYVIWKIGDNDDTVWKQGIILQNLIDISIE